MIYKLVINNIGPLYFAADNEKDAKTKLIEEINSFSNDEDSRYYGKFEKDHNYTLEELEDCIKVIEVF